MHRAAIPFLSLALGTIFLGAARKPISASPSPRPVRPPGIASSTFARALAVLAPGRVAFDGDSALTHRRLRDNAAGTYIDDILRERDSAIIRWPDRHGIPLRVWIKPTSPIQDFSAEYVTRVRSAFTAWNTVHLPVTFSFVPDSAKADVHVAWIDRFKEPISGRTHWTRDDEWTITDANILLAVHHSQGDQLDDDSMGAMALHEIGHLIGLDHTTDSLTIMAPRVRIRQLSEADRATARLLYELPIGPLP
jgi:hypothetical protein